MDQFDINPEMKKLYEAKQKQRANAKAYYQNLVSNPYRPVNDGAIFDPGTFRYGAMSSYHVELFKRTPKSYLKFFTAMSPIVMLYFYIRHYKLKKEKILRSGVVKYEDRRHKFYY